jgi:fructoselysine-6-P-deglycase FrlB-like protein
MSSSAASEPSLSLDPRADRGDGIERLPTAIADSITANFEAIRPAAAMILAARRVRICGVGVSASAAQVGEYLLRAVGIDARAADALDLVAQPANFDAGDLLITVAHVNGRAYTARVLQRALHSGLKTIALGDSEGALRGADVRIETAGADDASNAAMFLKTVAIFGALAARAEPRSPLATLVPRLADGTRRAIAPSAVEQIEEMAAFLADGERRVVVTGVGPGFAAARVAALELRTVLRAPVDALQLEDAIHGGLLHLRRDDLVIQIAPEGSVDDRQSDLATLVDAAGVARWRIGGKHDGARWHAASPGLNDLFDAALAVVPITLLAAALTTEREPSLWDALSDTVPL